MATILTTSDAHAAELAAELLKLADDPSDVVTNSSGARISFEVPDELAAQVGSAPVIEAVDAEPEVVEKPARRTAARKGKEG